MGTLWVLDSYLFTESNLKQLLQTGLMPVPRLGPESFSIMENLLASPCCVFLRELTLFRILFTICPLCQPCACESLLPVCHLFPDFTRDLIIKHVYPSRTGENLIPWPWFSCWDFKLSVVWELSFSLCSSRPQHIKAKHNFSKCLTKQTNDKYQVGVVWRVSWGQSWIIL